MRDYILNRCEMYIYDMTSEKKSNLIMKSLQSFHKKLSLMRAFVDVDGKIKHCVSCGNTATQEAVFTVDGATILEKYCDTCAKKNIS
jgi:hypothetical protein